MSLTLPRPGVERTFCLSLDYSVLNQKLAARDSSKKCCLCYGQSVDRNAVSATASRLMKMSATASQLMKMLSLLRPVI